MWTKKTYHCRCHVCGQEFDRESEFMSGAVWQQPDGRELVVLSCGQHEPGEIRAAWNADHWPLYEREAV